ncbi:hypothetical protein DSECCO2_614690 [anaerobic digester metagenome]|nr:hypothetical protein [Lentimicrobiaceae bacterium]
MPDEQTEYLLAVDVGVKTGLALFDNTGKLHWHRSHNMGSVPSLRKAADNIAKTIPDLKYIVAEGGGRIGLVWKKVALRYGKIFLAADARDWRSEMLYSREQRTGLTAKQTAIEMAIHFLKINGTPPPQILIHDSAEAILTGIWCCHKIGWIKKLPNLH